MQLPTAPTRGIEIGNLHQRLQPSRLDFGVVVEKGKIAPGAGSRPHVAAGGEPEVDGRLEDTNTMNARRARIEHRMHIIVRAVEQNEDLVRRPDPAAVPAPQGSARGAPADVGSEPQSRRSAVRSAARTAAAVIAGLEAGPSDTFQRRVQESDLPRPRVAAIRQHVARLSQGVGD